MRPSYSSKFPSYAFVFILQVKAKLSFQLAEEYDKLKADPAIRHPEKHMLNKHRKAGQYQGCFSNSHWSGKRKRDKWDLFCETAPKLARKCHEIPNSIKQLLNIGKLKHSNGRFKVSEGTRSLPIQLAFAWESMLLERMQLGEEVTSDFAQTLFLQLVEEWNSAIADLAEKAREQLGVQILREHDSTMEDTGDTADNQALAARELERLTSSLQACAISKNLTAVRLPGCSYSMCSRAMVLSAVQCTPCMQQRCLNLSLHFSKSIQYGQ